MLLSGTGDLLGRTALEIQTQTDKSIFYGCIGQYLIGENAAVTRFSDIVGYFAAEQELRLGTKVYVVRSGTAGETMAALAADGVSVSDRLETWGKTRVSALSARRTVSGKCSGSSDVPARRSRRRCSAANGTAAHAGGRGLRDSQ